MNTNVIHVDFATRERREFIREQRPAPTLRETLQRPPLRERLTSAIKRSFPWTDPGPDAA